MKESILILVVLAIGLAVPVHAAYYVAGDFNDWNAAGNPMTETSSGIWSVSLSGLSVGRHEFKITTGTWAWNYPGPDGPNSWLYTDGLGNVTITFNANVVSDGWLSAQYRLGLNTDPGSWAVPGSFNGWNNTADPMTPIGGGIYMLSKMVTPGTHQFKAVVSGTWDAITDVARIAWGSNQSITTSKNYEFFNLFVNATGGIVSVGAEPANVPHDPNPAQGQQGVLVDGIALSWAVARDPNGLAEPNLVSHKLYMSDGSTTAEPNLVYVATITGWDTETLRASYTPGFVLNKDGRYFWRVDKVRDDATEIAGPVWMFDTELTVPVIANQTVFQIVNAGAAAAFSVTVTSPSPVTYQWYKYVDGISDLQLADGGNISGATTDTLSVANAQLADEGYYYCVVNNDSGQPRTSNRAPLGIKRMLAYWPFEGNDPDSTVAGSPASFLYHSPTFVSPGVVGDAMEFDNDPNLEDILYTDPDQASYFDICNYSMTAACWIKSSFAATWGPMVARNGEEDGWQLRHNGNTLDRICFTASGTANAVGTASNRTVYDGNWHYVVGTFDGAVKKVYIDGVISRVYSIDNGSIVREYDEAAGVITASGSPVALAGRVSGNPSEGLIFESWTVTPCILDEVEIYNYALDAATIAQTYADISDTAVCPTPQLYDLNGDCIVNLDDFALLASEWLSDISIQPAP